MRVAKSGSEEGVSVNAKSRASQNLRFENKSARSGTKRERERERGKKGALKARTCPTSSKLAHMLLTAAILTAEFWFG